MTEISSARLERGWRYPFTKAHVAESLEAHRASVAAVALSMPDRKWRESGFVISTFVHGNATAAYFGEPDRASWTRLTIHALPEGTLQALQREELYGALAKAAKWIAEVHDRGNAWLATDHSWTAQVVDSRIETTVT